MNYPMPKYPMTNKIRIAKAACRRGAVARLSHSDFAIPSSLGISSFVITASLLLLLTSGGISSGQSGRPPDAASDGERLTTEQSRVASRYERLQLLAGRLAELSRSTQPRRTQLLRELISQSKRRDVAGRFQAIIDDIQDPIF